MRKIEMPSSVRPSLCNEAIECVNDAVLDKMKTAAATKIAELLDVLGVDHRNDHNTRGTPFRVARMLVEELLVGRYSEPPNLTEFENVLGFDQLITIGPIEVRSICAHHMLPIYGSAFIGVLPAADGKILGLSKYDRVVQYFSARFQIQEELVTQIGHFIEDRTKPRGLAVCIDAVHMCKTHRGVRGSHKGRMISSFYSGLLQHDRGLREEFRQQWSMLQNSGEGA